MKRRGVLGVEPGVVDILFITFAVYASLVFSTGGALTCDHIRYTLKGIVGDDRPCDRARMS